MMKKPLCLALLTMLIFTGCGNNSAISNTAHKNTTTKQTNLNKRTSIPFKYAFTGFVYVDDVINGLPTGTKIFNNLKQWQDFAHKSFPYNDIPLPVYSGGIDFTKNSLIYYSVFDAKGDFYAKAWQFDKITVKNHQLNITTKDLDGNLTITANNSEKKGGQRYVILATVDKKYLNGIK